MQNGKGDSPRKKGVSEEIWAKNWERIFGLKKPKKSEKDTKTPT